ncbi:divalent metal cation transporter [Candidatus Parcubacteria bacterium]|nr:MAG: divalent metal cation transporter [Candidatus Parcubacteria bacterium]
MKRIKRIISFLGPGFITGAADDDPSGIVAYSQTGAVFGLKQLWTAPFSFPFMYVVQEMCGKIGLVTGKGLAGVIKTHYKPWLLYFSISLLFIANVINISTDLGAMAASLELLFNLPFMFWIIIVTLVTLALEIFVSYKVYSKYLKYLAFSLLLYIVSAFFIKIDFKEVLLSTIVPNFIFSKDYIFNIVAVFGTTISPYLFFWQSYEEVEEEVVLGKIKSMGAGVPRVFKRDIDRLRIDTAVGMFFSNLIMWFIIFVAGSTFYVSGIKDISTAADAAFALKPLAGDYAFILFALGIVGTGLLAVPILAGSCSYALSEALGMKVGLSQKLNKAHGFYGTIALAMIAGLLINFIGISPIKALYYTAILNGIIAPPLIFIILLISNNKEIMGERVNGRTTNILGLFIGIFMTFFSLLLIASLFGII